MFGGIFILALLVGCSNNEDVFIRSNTINVVFVLDEHCFMDKTTYTLNRNQNLTVTLKFDSGYSLDTINYDNYTSILNSDSTITLTLNNIRYSTRITPDVKTIGVMIQYFLNGGNFINPRNEDSYTIADSLSRHLRPNTSIGTDRIYRDGYTQVGWNTSPDGNGEHISLGSRFTVENYHTNLFATWAKWNHESEFEYRLLEDNHIALTKYLGPAQGEELVIPQTIHHYQVSEISANCFSSLKYQKVVLPYGLKKIENAGFDHCRIGTLVFFDNLIDIHDSSFEESLPDHLEIQAVLSPRFTTGNDNAQFAENMDRLILHQSEKKMVLFAGCSLSYGLNSPQLATSFPDYTICNMGVIGGTDASFQLACIAPYIKQDDIFIHTPEEMSTFQMLKDLTMDGRCFIMVEGNYQLLSHVTLNEEERVFDAYAEYCVLRLKSQTRSYSDFNSNYNEYGDIVFDRPDSNEDTYFDYDKTFNPDNINETSSQRLNHFYDHLTQKGAKVLFSYAPLNVNLMRNIPDSWMKANEFDRRIKESIHTTVISHYNNYLYSGRYFYDTDYHLTTNGAIQRTNHLIFDIQQYLLKEEL